MSTIRSSREIDKVFRCAQRSVNPLVLVLAARSPMERDPLGRVAFIAGKKLGNAVVRNRSKRVLRAAVREAGGPWPGHDVLVIARPQTAQASSPDVAKAIAVALRRLEVVS